MVANIAVGAITRRRVLAVAVLGTCLLSATLPARLAHAAISACRADPIVFLSNGAVVDLTVTIGTDIADVRQISYVLHVPAGVTVQRVVYTPESSVIHEALQVVADATTASYNADTVVQTGLRGVPVSVFMGVVGAGGAASTTADGLDQQHIVTQRVL